MNKCLSTLLLFFVLAHSCFSQSKTTLAKNKVKGATEMEIKNNISIAQTKEFYDANGEIIEEHKFDKIGKLKSIHKYTRNKIGDITEENSYDSKSKLKERRVVKHNDAGQKLEESFYNSKNVLTEQQKISWN